MFRISSKTVTVLGALALLALAPLADANGDFEQALDDFKRGKYVEAAAGFQAIVDGSPGYDYGHFMLGMSFLQMGKPAEAEDNFIKAIELNGDRFEYQHGLASAYFKRSNYAKVVATLKTAEPLATDARNQKALYKLRGFAYSGLEKWADAINDLEKARKLESSPQVLDRLSLAYYELGHYDKGLPVLREAIEADPQNSKLTGRMAKSLVNLGAESRDDAKKKGYYNEGLTYAESFQKANPTDFDANNLVGRAALGAKNYDRAEQAFKRVLAQKPTYCYAMVNLGKVYIAKQQWKSAEGILREGAECAPKMAVIFESLGYSLQKQKKLPEAVEQYEIAMKLKPSPSIQKLINTCQQNLEIAAQNEQMEAQEQKQANAIAAEEARVAEEERKRKEWEEKRKRDD